MQSGRCSSILLPLSPRAAGFAAVISGDGVSVAKAGGNNRYRQLVANTLIFGIGAFSSKVLVFFLMPLYTRVLSTEDYGVVDLIVQTANLLIPLVSVGISNAVIRFGLEKNVRKKDVFSVGLLTLAGGYLIFLLAMPAIRKIRYVSDYTWLVYLYVLTSALRAMCSQFVRARQLTRLYAFDGFLSTLTMVVFNILFLVVFRWGVVGYVMATVCSDFLSILFLFVTAGLGRYVGFTRLPRRLYRDMLRYCVPLIPTTVFWWITNVSDRYMVSYMLGSDANGLYAVSYKVPNIVVMISGIFMEAWQMSAVSEESPLAREAFFSRVFRVFQSMVFIVASGLILFAKAVTTILVSEEFYPSWQYIPLLVMATTFSCLVTFLGSVYMVEKKSGLTLGTTILGAVVNVALNFLLIPRYGVNGAAFATFFSYFAVFWVRAINTHRFMNVDWSLPRLSVNLVLLSCQTAIMIREVHLWVLYEVLLCLAVVLLNAGPFVKGFSVLLSHHERQAAE